jgi:hypothetical protein
MSRGGGAALIIVHLAIAGCAATPRPASVEPASAPAPSQPRTLEQSYRNHATELAAQQRWAEAAVQWDLLVLLRPDSKEYRKEAEGARQRGAEAAAAHLRAADEARKRGANDQAALYYLRALSADPGNVTAANGLKAIETERVRKAWLDRPPRIPYQPPGAQSQHPSAYDPSTEESAQPK